MPDFDPRLESFAYRHSLNRQTIAGLAAVLADPNHPYHAELSATLANEIIVQSVSGPNQDITAIGYDIATEEGGAFIPAVSEAQAIQEGFSADVASGIEDHVSRRYARQIREAALAAGIDSRIIDYSREYLGRYDTEYVQRAIDSADKGWPSYQDPSRLYTSKPRTGSKGGQQARVGPGTKQGGRFGRSLKDSDKFKEELQKVVVACLLENYDKKIKSGTGTLREAVAEGTLEATGGDLSFTYTIKDKERTARKITIDRGGYKTEHIERSFNSQRASTHYYGPIVFEGRPAIISSNAMVFVAGTPPQTFRRHIVGPAEPRNIFDLSQEQRNRIDTVIMHGMTTEIEQWLSSMGT